MNRPEDKAPELAAEIMDKAERLEQYAEIAQFGKSGDVLATWKAVLEYARKLKRVVENMNPHIMEIESFEPFDAGRFAAERAAEKYGVKFVKEA